MTSKVQHHKQSYSNYACTDSHTNKCLDKKLTNLTLLKVVNS